MKNRHRIAEQQYFKPEPLRPIFQQNEIQQQGVWMELIPGKLKMILVEPGLGPNPKVGQFIRIKQFVYNENMALLKQQRITYILGRNKLILCLQYTLSLSKQGSKFRLIIDSSLAYGPRALPGIPSNSNLIMDIQVCSITPQPLSAGQRQDQQLVSQIIKRAEEGDQFAKCGDQIAAQRSYEYAFYRIQSTRCKQIKNYMYNQTKVNYMVNSNQRTQDQIKKQMTEIVQLYKIFDLIKIKTAQIALINKDYYKAIILTKQCMLQSRLQRNQRVLMVRVRSFSEIGEFKKALQLCTHLHHQTPQKQLYLDEIERIKQKQKQINKYLKDEMLADPVISMNGTMPKKKKKNINSQKYLEQQEGFQGDGESIIHPMEPFILGQGVYQNYKRLDELI